MGVEPGSKQIRDLQRHHRWVTLLVLLSTQVLTASGVGLLLITTDVLHWQDKLLWIIIGSGFLMSSGALLMAMPAILRPFHELLTALAHKIGETTLAPPPNPNARRHAKTGMKTALRAIYETPMSPVAAQPAPSDVLLTQALNHTSCGVVVLNPDKRIISANRAAPIAYSQTGDPHIALDFLDDQSLDSWLAECDATTISAERRWRRISTSPEMSQQQRIFDVVASYEKGAPGETVVMLFDRSEQYVPEEEDLNFIAFAAHELRGPITVIRGYLDVLEQELADRLKGDEPELLARLIVSGNRLSSYINNILNVARFDRHHLKVHLVEDSVAHIYASIADDMQLRAQSQHRMLSVAIPDNLPTVAADRGSISEVISNLIDNAIKYSFEGGVVTITAAAKGEFVEVSVTDNGIGMPASVVNNLFRKFYRSHRSREAVAGTGIGLYICKAFVESHGGTITARSQEHTGSTFTFTLPIYDSIKDKLLEDGQLNQQLIRHGGGWIKNHAMYRG